MAEWDESSARAVVTSLVAKRIRAKHFESFATLDKDFLIDEGLDAARKAWGTYDRRKGQPSTFIHRVAVCRIIDLLRSENRRVARDTAWVMQKPGVTYLDLEDEPSPAWDDLTEWLGNIHRMIRRNFATYGVPLKLTGYRGRPFTYDRVQASALLALKKHKKLSIRGLAMLLDSRPDLLAAIGLQEVPSHGYLASLELSVQQIDFTTRRIAI